MESPPPQVTRRLPLAVFLYFGLGLWCPAFFAVASSSLSGAFGALGAGALGRKLVMMVVRGVCRGVEGMRACACVYTCVWVMIR